MAETTTAAATPTIAYEYIGYAGEPLAQVETANGAIHYYFNDHLGTPLLTTSSTGVIDWRVEREPYGRIAAIRVGANRHQPLSFPGQEDARESSRSYNIFRWYRAAWGRSTQSDPLAVSGMGMFTKGRQRHWPGPERYVVIESTIDRTAAFVSDMNGFVYAGDNPTAITDPLGLDPLKCEVKTLKPTPIAGWCPFFGTCTNLYTGAVIISAGMMKALDVGNAQSSANTSPRFTGRSA